jgi:hypothetical protein
MSFIFFLLFGTWNRQMPHRAQATRISGGSSSKPDIFCIIHGFQHVAFSLLVAQLSAHLFGTARARKTADLAAFARSPIQQSRFTCVNNHVPNGLVPSADRPSSVAINHAFLGDRSLVSGCLKRTAVRVTGPVITLSP